MDKGRTEMTNPARDDRRLGEKIFWLLVVAAALHMVYYYPLLPERMASHFDFYGRPNGWSSKNVFFSIYAGIVTLMVIIQITTKLSSTKMPSSLINLPNRDYWLAPERVARSMTVLMKYMSGFWTATLSFLIGTMHLAIRANLGWGKGLGDWFFVLLGGYIFFVIAWTASLIRHFSKKPSGQRSHSSE